MLEQATKLLLGQSEVHRAFIIKRRHRDPRDPVRFGRYGYTWECMCGAEGKKLVDRYRAVHLANGHIEDMVKIEQRKIRERVKG